VVPSQYGITPFRIADEGAAPQAWIVAAKIMNKKLRTADNG